MNGQLILGVSIPLLVSGFVLWAASRPERERRRHRDSSRKEVFGALREQFALSESDGRLSGSVDGRPVSVQHEGEYLTVAHVTLHVPVLPLGVRLVEFPDGPYQKYEERAIGGAHAVGDAQFDAKFLAYGEPGDLSRIEPEVLALMVRHWIEGVGVRFGEVTLYVPAEANAAVDAIRRTLALCDALEASVRVA
ncbi:MAG: hypothetical protein ACE37F_32245 [Nannocystaceae bacterium]|nr:hypothetical protein [bacterium]